MSRQKYKMIYFFGSDGTGKTVQANLLSSYLSQKGYRVWRTSVKYHHTLSYQLLKIITGRNPDGQAISYYGFNGKLKDRIRTPWKILELISLMPAIFYRVFLPISLGYIVVCDRYIIDSIITLSYFLGDYQFPSSLLSKMLSLLVPKHSRLFYMEADTKVILKRKRDEPLTNELVEYYKKTYKHVIQNLELSAITLDTSDNAVLVTQSSIRQRLNI